MIDERKLILALTPLGPYKSFGNQLKYNCSICEANGAPTDKFNLEVNPSKGIMHCWACHYKGTIFKLIQEHGVGDMARLFKREKHEETEEVNEEKKVLDLPREIYNVLKHKEATDYLLSERGLTKETLKQRNIKWCFGGRYKGSMIFPSYTEDGVLNYFVAHNLSTKKYLMCKGVSKNVCFYQSFVDKRSPVLITEGIYDALVVPNSLPCLGVELNEEMLTQLANCDVILAFDSFVSSKVPKIASKQLREMGAMVQIVQVPNEYDDINELAVTNKTLLKELLLPHYSRFTLTN